MERVRSPAQISSPRRAHAPYQRTSNEIETHQQHKHDPCMIREQLAPILTTVAAVTWTGDGLGADPILNPMGGDRVVSLETLHQ